MSSEAPEPLARVQALFKGYAGGWWIAGGWAADLVCPAPVREHKDVDVLVRDDQTPMLFDHLAAYAPVIEHPHTGERRTWAREDALVAGPDTIVLPEVPGVQLLVGRFEGEEWVYPRGSGRTRVPVDRLGLAGRHGLRVQAPEVVLLFKSREDRPENDLDFAAVAPLLSAEARAWLRTQIAHRQPDHAWLERLD